jgi:hypothetical protein
MCVERLARSTQTPTLQEPVHVNDGEQRTDNSALLRRAAGVALAATHAPRSIAIPLFDRRFQS